MATLSTSDQQVWKKVLAARNKAMNQKAIQISLPGMTTKEVTSSISALIKLQLLATEKGKDGTVIFHGQAADDAKKKSTFTAEQAIVLQTISQAGNNGISPKVLRNHIGPEVIPSTSLRRILDGLEKSNQVKVFKGINAPTVSLYILPHLKPPEEITGGIWFDTTKEYDAELVDTIHGVLLNYVRKLTFPKQCQDEQASGQNPIYSTDRTSLLPTPHALLHHVNKLNVTSVKLNVKNVMECMRALELDGLVEAVKPLWDVRVPGDDAFDDDEGHVGNLRNKRNGDNDDYDKRSKWTEREKNKMKERMKDIKRREKEKEKEKEKERDTTRVKDKRKKERTKAKAKEKERERKAKRKRKEKVRQQEQLRGRSESIKPTARPKKRRKIVEDDDSEPPLISVDDEGNLDRMQQKKMERIPSVSSASSSPASSRPASSASSASSSPSSSSNSEIDSGSDSEISVSSVDSADLDVRAVQLKPKFSTAFAAAHSQSLSFAGAGLQDLSDTAIIYRATNRLTIPRGLNQTPCGKCPQFGFCEEGGPVNADSCRYYADWLGDRVGGWDAEGRNRFHPVDGECEEEAATQEFEGEED